MTAIDDTLANIEQHITNQNVTDARKELRRWLSSQVTSEKKASSVGEWLFLLAESTSKHSMVAAVIVRCASVQGLLQPNQHNQIERSVVQIVEKGLPDFVTFLRIQPKEQTYLKYETLTKAHGLALRILEPFYRPYGDLQGVVQERQAVIGVLRHKGLRDYLKTFGLDEIRSRIERIYGDLSRVVRLEDTLLDDLEACHEGIKEATDSINQLPTFLGRECFSPFLNNLNDVLNTFMTRMQGRFSAKIELGPNGDTLRKRYPLHEENRRIRISVPMKNTGPGRAIDVRVVCEDSDDSISLDSLSLLLGNVAVGEFEVNLNCQITTSCSDINFILDVEWGEIDSPQRKSCKYYVQALSQSSDVDWGSLEYLSPYSTEVAEGDAFVGREDKVKQLAGKMLRTPIEPFYLTGQRRVGKTSLAIESAKVAVENTREFQIETHYVLWGSIADVEPASCLRRLGTSIHDFICGEVSEVTPSGEANYDGSLADLVALAKSALKHAPNRRFLIIIDEIDEMPTELYLSGDLASTFFANLRALSRERNIGIILVGGENMPFIMDRQGQRLNNFSRINLTSFDRATEWDDFRLLVQKPTKSLLNWHEEAVSEIYNVTNGNPYFAKLVCADVFRRAVRERDSDVTAREVKTLVDREVSNLGANSFVHLWQDGISRAEEEREPEVLRRLRVLIAFARCLRKRVKTSVENIQIHRASDVLLESETLLALNEFCRRGIMHESDDCYLLTLPIFDKWLVDVGVSQLVVDGLSEEIANGIVAMENAELVMSSEIAELVDDWPTYRGVRIGSDDVRAWFEQVESKRHQRILFELLGRVRVYSEVVVRERLASVHSIFRKTLPTITLTGRREIRNDILVTYADGPGKSGASYASLYAEENGIGASYVVAPELLEKKFSELRVKDQTISAIVLIDDIAATGNTLCNLLMSFCSNHSVLLKDVLLKVAVLVATQEASVKVNKAIAMIDELNIEFRVAEVLSASERAFPKDSLGWESEQRRDEAEALCRDLGTHIYRQRPFGFGGQGLLVVFPTTVPNNSLPILHSQSKDEDHPWRPLFPRLTN